MLNHRLIVAECQTDGAKLNYTFFAPTSLAFLLQTPQDTVDPLVVDANFRIKVLIRHFTRQSVSSNDLARLDRLVMADSNVAAITRSVGNSLRQS